MNGEPRDSAIELDARIDRMLSDWSRNPSMSGYSIAREMESISDELFEGTVPSMERLMEIRSILDRIDAIGTAETLARDAEAGAPPGTSEGAPGLSLTS